MARPKPIPPAPLPMALEGALWLQCGGSRLGGADRIGLLEAIHATGSMLQAAKAVGISYKTAWDRVQDMNNVSGQPLVDRAAGGAGGGGTVLTAHGLSLVAAFRQIEAEHAAMLQRLSTSIADPGGTLQALTRLGLKTSARNQLAGTVSAVQRDDVNSLLTLALPGADDRVLVSLTTASLDELGLAEGAQAVALIKAPWVQVSPEAGLPSTPELNRLRATVTRLQPGRHQAELQAQLRGGQTMVALMDLDNLQRSGVAEGSRVGLSFAGSSVILGVV